MNVDSTVAVPARLIGDPARAAMLQALASGTSLPAGELAKAAKIQPSTASEHLGKLVAGGLITVERQGRNRYYRLASNDVGNALEALQLLAPAAPIRSLKDSNAVKGLSFARSCYSHLGGELAVRLSVLLTDAGVIAPLRIGETGRLVDADHPLLRRLDVRPRDVSGRPVVKGCLDWTHRRPHLAGGLGRALLDSMLRNGWLLRTNPKRALRLTNAGRSLTHDLGLLFDDTRPASPARAHS